jgi:cation:H+ antiporter
MFENALLFFVGFFFIWVGSGLIVSSADRIAKSLKLSSFALSFFILGLLTSIPEFSLGVSSLVTDEPEIIVGTLLGGIVVMFLLVIPLLAIMGNGIKLSSDFDKTRMTISLMLVTLPSLFVLDQKISFFEGIFMVIAYITVLIYIQSKKGVLSEKSVEALAQRTYSFLDIGKVILGVVIVFLASALVVDKTEYFANIYSISPFLIGLVLLSIGTNLPELSLSVRSVIQGKKDVAFGDYIGSASANTLLLGLFATAQRGNIVTVERFYLIYLFTLIAVVFFYFFARSEKKISRTEGFILLTFYVLFILFEVIL